MKMFRKIWKILKILAFIFNENFQKNLKNSEKFSFYVFSFQWKLSEKSENSNLFCFYFCSFIIFQVNSEKK